jgi:hypothetical protein
LFLNENNVDQGINTCLSFGFTGLMMDNSIITVEDVNTIKSSGLSVGIFGVNRQSQTKNALNKFPDQIQTDNIELAHRIIYK